VAFAYPTDSVCGYHTEQTVHLLIFQLYSTPTTCCGHNGVKDTWECN